MPRNILIDPQRTGTANPNIQFSGSMDNTIRLEVLTSGSVQFTGVSGSLLSITDALSGSLFAVSDVSGLPIIEAFSDDRVVMGQFNTNALVVSGSQVGIGTPPIGSDRLAINGNVGISGSIIPYADSLYSIGSATRRWASIFASSISGSLIGSNLTAGQVVVAGTGGAISGSNNFVWDNTNGRVGIGTATPSSQLYLYTAARGTYPFTIVAGTSGYTFYNDTGAGYTTTFSMDDIGLTIGHNSVNRNIYFGINSSPNIMISGPTGNVGIGTNSYTSRFHVQGSSTASTPTMIVREGVVSPTGGVGVFDVQNSAGTSLFFVSGSGNVGIGTTPGRKLDVNGVIRSIGTTGVSSPTLELLSLGAWTWGIRGDGQGLVFLNDNNERMRLLAAGTLGVTGSIEPGGDNQYNLGSLTKRWNTLFATNISGSLTPTGATAGSVFFAGTAGQIQQDNANFFWDDANNSLGIGTNSPASQLHVFNSSTSLNVLVETTSAPSNSGFYLRHPSNDGYFINRGDLSLFLFDATAWPILIRTLAAQPVSIHTNGTERLRVTSGGNVGIGGTNPISRFEVTGSTGDSSAAALHLVNASGASILYARNDQYIGVGTSTLTSGRSITTAADIDVYGVRVGRGGGGVSDNTAVGASALNANTTGVENAAFGNNSLAANLGGSYNTAAGFYALSANTTGIENTAVGRYALGSNTIGGRNIAIGRASLFNMINGSYNTAVGVNALFAAASSSENTALGYGSLWNSTGGNNTAVGSQALYGVSGQSTATNNTAIGIYAGYSVTSGGSNFFGGREAGYSNSIAENNVLIGYRAGYLITSGSDNVAIGYEALRNSNGNGGNGRTNTAIGTAAMYSATTALNCVAVGWNAGYSYVSADSSTSVGIYSAYYQTGDNNTAIGRQALQGSSGLSTGAGNTAIGRNAGYSLTTGNYNFFGGYEAGFYITSGSNNVVIGYNAQAGGWADSNSIVIGQGAVGLGTNTTVLGHSSTTLTSIPAGNVGIGTTLLDSKLVVNGNSVFSGSVNPSADNTYDLGSSTKRWANVNATNVVSSGSLGISYAQTSTDGTTAIFDTITLTSFTGGAVYELMILANPNVGGSGAYRDVVYGKVIVGTGYNGAAVTTYIQYVNESPAPRSLYPTSGGPITADVVFLQSGSEKTDVASGTTATIRVKVSGYGGTVGAGTTVRLKLLISG